MARLQHKNQTTVNDKVTTKKFGDETKTREQYTEPLSQEQMQDFKTNYEDPLRQQYMIDPNGKFIKNDGNIATLFGFDPKEYEAQEAAKQKAVAFKRKESGWANALKVVSDIATAAHGGNVYNAPMSNVGKEASLAEHNSKSNIINMGKAINDAIRGQELGFAKERQNLFKQYIDKFAKKQDITTTKKEDDVITTKGGGSVTTGWHDVKDETKGGDGSGSGNGRGYIMNFRTTNGKAEGINISNKEADAVIGLLKAHYTKLLNSGNTKLSDDYMKRMNNEHMIKSIDADGNIQFDENQLLRSGLYFGLDQGLKDRIVKATNGKVKFTTGEGWGNVTKEKEYDF